MNMHTAVSSEALLTTCKITQFHILEGRYLDVLFYSISSFNLYFRALKIVRLNPVFLHCEISLFSTKREYAGLLKLPADRGLYIP